MNHFAQCKGNKPEKDSFGAPVMTNKEVKDMIVTIQRANCSFRPDYPNEPWPEKSDDCWYWYTANHSNIHWNVNFEVVDGEKKYKND